jgi:hypothetical protein
MDSFVADNLNQAMLPGDENGMADNLCSSLSVHPVMKVAHADLRK